MRNIWREVLPQKETHVSTPNLAPSPIPHPLIIPGFRYRSAPAAIEWLCNAFGFSRHAVYPGDNGTIAHAQLLFGNSMIMLGSVRDGGISHLLKHPDQLDGASTLSLYVIVPDADDHYARAKSAGAVIVRDIQDEDYGGRGYTCRDLESYLWSFGTYNPWSV